MITKILRFLGLITVRRSALLGSRLHEYYVFCVQNAVEKDFGAIPRPEAIENSRECMKWVSIQERIPDKPGQYWCYDMDEAECSGSCRPWVDWFDPERNNDFMTTLATDMLGTQFVVKDYAVTHWAEMILPDPPKGE